jgi:hypothetical protein
VHDLATSLALDPETAALLREVAQRKEAAVAAEDFAAAKTLKVLQDAIKEVGGTLAQLVADKGAAGAWRRCRRFCPVELRLRVLTAAAGVVH